MTDYDRFRQEVCTQCIAYFLECETTEAQIIACIHADNMVEYL